MGTAQPNVVTRRVHKRATDPAVGDDPSAAAIRREAEVLCHPFGPGVVQLLAHGEQPLPWMETADAGPHTLAGQPPDPGLRLSALSAAAEAVAQLHRAGWAHRRLKPSHVIWDAGPPACHGVGPPDPNAPPVHVTLCSLASAVHPASPAELQADRSALAEVMAAGALAGGDPALPPSAKAGVLALADELRSGDLDHAATAAVALAELAASLNHSITTTGGHGRSASSTPGSSDAPVGMGHAVGRWRGLRAGRSAPSPPKLAALAALALLVIGALALAAAGGSGAESQADSGPAGSRCSQPQVPAPRVDAAGDGCGSAVGYDSGVLIVGPNRWSLGDDVVDGRLVDLDADGWSELAALRRDGEVFLVRRFPVNAANPVRVRSLASVPDAVALASLDPGNPSSGTGLGARTVDGEVTTVVEPTPAGGSP